MCAWTPHIGPISLGNTLGARSTHLQRWDGKGILQAHRSPTNQRYYQHDQCLASRGLSWPHGGSRQSMQLWKRTYRCGTCGLVLDRDVNSAVNILQRFLILLGLHAGEPVRCAAPQAQ